MGHNKSKELKRGKGDRVSNTISSPTVFNPMMFMSGRYTGFSDVVTTGYDYSHARYLEELGKRTGTIPKMHRKKRAAIRDESERRLINDDAAINDNGSKYVTEYKQSDDDDGYHGKPTSVVTNAVVTDVSDEVAQSDKPDKSKEMVVHFKLAPSNYSSEKIKRNATEYEAGAKIPQYGGKDDFGIVIKPIAATRQPDASEDGMSPETVDIGETDIKDLDPKEESIDQPLPQDLVVGPMICSTQTGRMQVRQGRQMPFIGQICQEKSGSNPLICFMILIILFILWVVFFALLRKYGLI